MKLIPKRRVLHRPCHQVIDDFCCDSCWGDAAYDDEYGTNYMLPDYYRIKGQEQVYFGIVCCRHMDDIEWADDEIGGDG
jgi:hypothetical protein